MMVKIEINTTILKSEMKLTMHEEETVRDLVWKVAQKIGENFTNQKLYVLLPVYKHQDKQRKFLPSISNYGGITTSHQDTIFTIAQSNGHFDYDSNYLNLRTQIKNLKTSKVQLTERIYVDKPIGK